MIDSTSNQRTKQLRILDHEPRQRMEELDSFAHDMNALSSNVYNRRLMFAFGLPMIFFVVVGVGLTVASPLVTILVSLVWISLYQAIGRYAPSVEQKSKALQQTCYSWSFLCVLLVSSIIFDTLLLPIRSSSVWSSRCQYAYISLGFAMACVLLAALLRYQTPFAFLPPNNRTYSGCGVSSPFYKKQSLAEAFVAFLSDITSSSSTLAEESKNKHPNTATTTTANNNLMSRTVYLTTAHTAVARDETTQADSSSTIQNQHLVTNPTFSTFLIPTCLFQLLLHAILGSFFGIFCQLAISSIITTGNTSLQFYYSTSSDISTSSTILTVLAGIASFVGFLSTMIPMDVVGNQEPIDSLDISRYNHNFVATVWNLVHTQTIYILRTQRNYFVRIGYSFVLGYIGWNLLGVVWDCTYHNNVKVNNMFSFVQSVVQVLVQFYILLISIFLYTFGVSISVLVDTFGRVVFCQPLHLKRLAKEYKKQCRRRIPTREATNVPTKLFLHYFVSTCCENNSHDKHLILEYLLSSRKNMTTTSHWINPDSLEVQRIDDVTHFLVDSWKSKNVGTQKLDSLSFRNAMCWTWILESFGGRYMSPLHSSNIQECLLLHEDGISITRCLLVIAGAYGRMLTESVDDETTATTTMTKILLCPAAAYQAELCIRGAARMISASSRSSRQSTMIQSLLRTAYKLHQGACGYVDRMVPPRDMISTTRSSSSGSGVTTTAAPLQPHQLQQNVSKATYILQQVAGSDEHLRKLCAYELDQMRVPLGNQLGCLVVLYRLLVTADEAIVLLSGVIRNEGLDRSCRAWIDGVLAAVADPVQ